MKTNFQTDNARWQAVAKRDPRADGHFVYCVKTTGVYCKPSCNAPSRALRENVEFHPSPQHAEHEGFRACRRCKPTSPNSRDEVIAKACAQLNRGEVNLETLAKSAGLSPSHFHRFFKAQTGVTPKAFALANRASRVRNELKNGNSVSHAIYRAGFNSNGRFYATSKKLLGMMPKHFRAGGEGAEIRFAIANCSLGKVIVAASGIGVCFIALGDDSSHLVKELHDEFPTARLTRGDKSFTQLLKEVVAFVDRPAVGLNLPLDIRGTTFQQRVWKKLTEIPLGETKTYSQIAREMGVPKSTRAVASACANNNISLAIPCHRVVKTDGSLAGYRWGIARKSKLLKAERDCGPTR